MKERTKEGYDLFVDEKREEYLIQRLLELPLEKLEYVIKGLKTRLKENDKQQLVELITRDESTILDIDQVKDILIKNQERLVEDFCVRSIGVFGSYAKRTQTIYSDIDILVEFYEGSKIGFKFIALKDFLEGILGRNVDVMTYDSVKDSIKSNIEKEVVYVWRKETTEN